MGCLHERVRWSRTLGAVPLTALLVLAAIACAPEVSGPPNVMIVVLDTARVDRLSAYGYPRATTPRLEALARESISFDRAWSTSSWTSPAHASLFTGLYPAAHRTTQENWTLSPQLRTLAEIFAERGYETTAVVGNPILSREYGFDQGFGRFLESWRAEQGVPPVLSDRASADAVKHFLQERDAQRPFFLFVNLIGPHSPYDSCEEGCERWLSDPSRERVANDWHRYYLGRLSHSEADLQHLGERYDAELHAADAVLGEMIDALSAENVIDQTILVVTSDHGENFGDHGHVDHVFSLHETTTRIPLVIRFPDAFEAGSRDELGAQLPDVFTTVLALAGFGEAASAAQGVDLRDEDARRERPLLLEYARPVQALSILVDPATPSERKRLEHWDRSLTAIVHYGLKGIWSDDGERELYDLELDPEERVNLAELEPYRARMAELEQRAVRLRDHYAEAQVAPTEQAPLSVETQRALRVLGYLEE